MSKALLKSKAFFLLLIDCSAEQGKALLRSVDTHQTLAIGEIVHNLLIGNIKISTRLKKKLSKSKSLLRKVGKKDISIADRRKLIVKNYNFFWKLIKVLKSCIQKKIK